MAWRSLFEGIEQLRNRYLRAKERRSDERRAQTARLRLERLENRWLMATGLSAISQYALPSSLVAGHMASGPGGKVWADDPQNAILSSTTSGSISFYTPSGEPGLPAGGSDIVATPDLTAGSDGNTVNFEAHGDQFTDNTGNSATDHGGLLIRGLENVSIATGGTNNTVNIALWGCRMLGNTETDLYAVGAHSTVASTAPLDQNNQVTIEIHGDGNGNGKWQPVEFFANSLPSPPDYGNSVTVID